MSSKSLDRFLDAWSGEHDRTLSVLRSLPVDQYDFRPDPNGRSLGELAWHLAEVEAYMTFGVESGKFDHGAKPPGIERPRMVEALAPGYQRVHADAVARVKKLAPADLDREIRFFDGGMLKVSEILWLALLHHLIHHRGQLTLMNRLAGGKPPGIFGPNREEMEAMRAR